MQLQRFAKSMLASFFGPDNLSLCSDFNICTAAKLRKYIQQFASAAKKGHFHDSFAGIFECSNQSFKIFLNCGEGFATMAKCVRKGLCVTE